MTDHARGDLTQTYSFGDAGALADAWLSVALASARDDERPALSRTLLVEFFGDAGVRLVATDGYVLLSGWVGTSEQEAPSLEEAPSASVVAIDAHGRAASLMGHLRRLRSDALKEGLPAPEATLRVGEPLPEPHTTAEFAGLEPQALIIDHPGREELALPLYEGDYPSWRSILGMAMPVRLAVGIELLDEEGAS